MDSHRCSSGKSDPSTARNETTSIATRAVWKKKHSIVAVAFPSLFVSAVCVLNIGLFVYMAIDDERVLLASTLGTDYENYKLRVGLFRPRFAAKR